MKSQLKLRNFISFFLLAFFVNNSFSFAQAELPQFFTLDGRLFEAGSSTEPLLDGSVVLTVQILNPAKTCILYEETETVSTLSTNGYFTARIGSATGAPERGARDSNNSMTTVFVNAAAPINGQTSGGGGCVYNPASRDVREFRFFITPSTVGSTAQLSDDMTVDSVPQALVAQTLQGLGPSNVFQTSATSTQAKLDNLLTTNYTTLTDVISGTSTLYLQNSAVGTQLPTRASDPGAPSPGQIWYDTVTNEIKYYNGSTIEAVGAAGPGVTSVTAGAGLNGGTISTTGTIAIDTEGVATAMIEDGAVTNVKLASGIDAAKVTTGTLPAGVVPTGTDNTKLPLDGSAAMTGALDFAGNNLLNTGHITMNAQRTMTIGRYDAGQQVTLIGTLAAPNAGATWYNTTTGKLMYWNGSAALEVSESTTAGGDITAINTNAGSGLTGGVTSGPATLAVNVDGTTLEVATNTVQVKDAGIDANKLASNAVTNAKIADDAVTSGKILNGEVTDAKINTVSVNKITSALGQYFTYAPNGGACGGGEVLKKTVNGWECGVDLTGVTDHGALTGLSDDDHSQYVMLAGRAGGQTLLGGTASGDDLTIESTSDATKGDVILQPTSGNVGIGTTAPNSPLTISSSIITSPNGLNIRNSASTNTYSMWAGTPGNFDGYLKFGVNPVDQNDFDLSIVASGIQMGTNNSVSLNGTGKIQANENNAFNLTFNSGNFTTLQSNTYTTFNTGGALERMRIDASGNVGIGTTSPTTLLDAATTKTTYPVAPGVQVGIQSNRLTYSPTGNHTSGIVAANQTVVAVPVGNTQDIMQVEGQMVSITQASSNTSVSYLYGLDSSVSSTGTNVTGDTYLGLTSAASIWNSAGSTLTNLEGAELTAYSNSGTITNITGSYNQARNQGATVTNNTSGYFYSSSSAGTTTNLYGLRVSMPISGGSVTNRYGVHIASSGATLGTDYGVYQDSASATNYFAGNVGIGTTNPASLLDVAGIIRATEICDEAGSNCKDLSSGWGAGGDIDGIVTNATTSGLSGGTASGTATLAVVTDNSTVEVNGTNQVQVKDLGITSGKLADDSVTSAKILNGEIVNADINAGAAIAWSKIDKTGAAAGDVGAVPTARNINTNAGSGLTGGGDLSADRSIAMNVDNSTIEIATNTVQVKDGGITNAKINSVSIGKIDSAVAEYFSYMPAGTECNNNEVLKWNAASDRWLCDTDATGGGVTDHGALTGLGDDDHTQYVMLAGRAGGQNLRGGTASGDDLTIESTSDATKGDVIIQPTGGNVGIGTTTPVQELEVNGDILLGAASPTLYLGNDSDQYISGNAASNFMTFSTANSERVRIDSSGSIGIGTTDPTFGLAFGSNPKLLALSGTGNTTDSIGSLNLANSRATATNLDYTGGINFFSLGNNSPTADKRTSAISTLLAGTGGANGFGGRMWFATKTDNGSLTNRMVLTENGRLGVGTFSPTNLLSVGTNSEFTVDTSGNVLTSGSVGIGTTSPIVSLDLNTKTDAIRIPQGTSAQQPVSAANGMLRYNTTNNKFEGYENGAWVNLRDPASNSSLTAAVGSAGAPSLSFTGEADTGFYGSGLNSIGISAGGAQIFDFNTVGLVSPTTGGANVLSGNGTAATPTYGFAGDTDTGWFRAAADNLAASTAGVERIRIGDTGNIGVGTTNPTYGLTYSTDSILFGITGRSVDTANSYGVLSVANNRATPSATDILGFLDFVSVNGAGAQKSGARIIAVSEGTGGAGGFGANLRFQTKTDNSTLAERMRITASGNVGVGTTTPSQKLDVVGTSEAASGTSPRGAVVVGASGTSGVLNMGVHSGTFYSWIQSRHNAAATYYNLALNPEGGNVGIGTTNPSAPLEVNGKIIGTNMQVGLGGGPNNLTFNGIQTGLTHTEGVGLDSYLITLHSGTNGWQIHNSFLQGSGGGGARLSSANSEALPAFAFRNDLDTGIYWAGADILAFSTNATEKMRIDAAGNVGIGITSPYGKLEVYGEDSNTASLMRVINGDSTVARYPGVSTMNYMGAAAAGSPQMTLANSRGTSSVPAVVQANDVLGSVNFSGANDATYGLANGATIYASAQENFSTTASGTKLIFKTTANGENTAADRMTITGAGDVGIGIATPAERLSVFGGHSRFTGADGNYTSHEVRTHSSTASWHAPYLVLKRGRGTASIPEYPLNVDQLGQIAFRNYNAVGDGAGILALASENHSALNEGTDLYFFTTPNGATASVNRMFVSNGGNVGIGTTNPESALQVNGGVQLGDDAAACPGVGNVKLGTLRYNGGALQMCVVSGWTAVSSNASLYTKASIRFTRTTVAYNASDATKTAQCTTEYGSNYKAGTVNELAATWGSSSSGNSIYFVIAGDATARYRAFQSSAFITIASNSIGTHPVACIYRYAPIRFTATAVAYNATDATKDAQCVTEFGSDYSAATQLDAAAIWSNAYPGASGLWYVLAADTANAWHYSGGNNMTSGAGGTYPVVCIR